MEIKIIIKVNVGLKLLYNLLGDGLNFLIDLVVNIFFIDCFFFNINIK